MSQQFSGSDFMGCSGFSMGRGRGVLLDETFDSGFRIVAPCNGGRPGTWVRLSRVPNIAAVRGGGVHFPLPRHMTVTVYNP